MSGASNAPAAACGHPGFCEPGSPECLAKPAPAKGIRPIDHAERTVVADVKQALADRFAEVFEGAPVRVFLNDPRQSGKTAERYRWARVAELSRAHGQGCTVSDPCGECRPPRHPGRRELDKLGGPQTSALGVLAGLGQAVKAAADLEAAQARVQYSLRFGLMPRELVDLLLADARHQLDRVTGEATLMHRGRPELVEQAVGRWHHDNPGLSRLLKIATPPLPKDPT